MSFQKLIMTLLVVVSFYGCGHKPPMKPLKPEESFEVTNDVNSAQLGQLRLDRATVTFLGRRAATGEPEHIDEIVATGSVVAPLEYVTMAFSEGDSALTCAFSDGSHLDVRLDSNEAIRDAAFFDARTRTVKTYRGTAGLSGAASRAILPIDHSGVSALATRTVLLRCDNGEPFTAAISVRGTLITTDGESADILFRRRPGNASVYDYQVPKGYLPVATPFACERLANSIRQRLKKWVFGAAFAKMCDFFGYDPRPLIVCRIVGLMTGALYGEGSRAAAVASCKEELAAYGGTINLNIVAWSGDLYTASVPVDWDNRGQSDEIVLQGVKADEVEFGGGERPETFGYFEATAYVKGSCFSTDASAYFMQATRVYDGTTITGDPKVMGASRNVLLSVKGLAPCSPYILTVFRTDANTRVVALWDVVPKVESVESIKYRPSDFWASGFSFSPVSQFRVWRSRNTGSSDAGVQLRQADANGQINEDMIGWRSLAFFGGQHPSVSELELGCGEGTQDGMRLSLKTPGHISGKGVRNERECLYGADGMVSLVVVDMGAVDSVIVGFKCTDRTNCDVAPSGILCRMKIPRESAKWTYYGAPRK